MMWIFGLAVIVMIGLGTYLYWEYQRKKDRTARAMALIGSVPPERNSPEQKSKAARDDIAKKLKVAATSARASVNKKSTAALLTQAGWTMSVPQFWMLSSASMFVAIAIAYFLTYKPIIMILAALIGLFGLPRMIAKMAGKKRQKQFLDEFADALDGMARLLKAGMPVGEAIAMCAREYTGPVGEEMRRMYDAQKVGVPLSEAAMEATTRMPIPEMRMLATALVIQQQTGSSLSEVLENLAGMIRARYRLKRKVLALSSEATASAAIIGALPVVVTLALKGVNPKYIDLLFQPGLGQTLLYSAIFWMVIGIFVMRQMINFKV